LHHNEDALPQTPGSSNFNFESYKTSERVEQLQSLIKSLSATTPTLKRADVILRCLQDAAETHAAHSQSVDSEDGVEVQIERDYSEKDAYEHELEWIVISKAAVQTYGLILDSLIDQTLPLSDNLFYWDEVMSDYRYTALYSLQTSPRRLWDFSWEVYADAMQRLQEIRQTDFAAAGQSTAYTMTATDGGSDDDTVVPDNASTVREDTLSGTLTKFYMLVKTSIRDKSLLDLNKRAVSPFSLTRQEIKKKQVCIRRLKEMQASGLGVLINEGLSFETDEEQEDWKGVVERSIVLMENVLRHVTKVDQTVDQFEDVVFSGPPMDVENNVDPTSSSVAGRRNSMYGLSLNTQNKIGTTSALSEKLQGILAEHLPAQALSSKQLAQSHGKPGIITRYWLPAIAFILSSGTVLRILVNRKAAITTWIQELGATIIDFWENWVIEPTRRIIGTIRHDQDSEVALMGSKSLASDMDSLERMVVDFAIDNPDTVGDVHNTTGTAPPLDDVAIAALRSRIKDGDLTCVLKVYEKDLKQPFRGAVRGELIRALLIQIQKTKVDVEVAISGIDRLLKSQELVFGFIGLTPGVLVCVGLFRWFRGNLGGKKSMRKSEVRRNMLRTMRYVHSLTKSFLEQSRLVVLS